MATNAQLTRIHMGDEEAFGEFFRAHNLRVYHRALAVLNDRLAARAVVIEAFTAFRAEIRATEGPYDAEDRLYALTEEAILRVDELRQKPAEQAPEKPDEQSLEKPAAPRKRKAAKADDETPYDYLETDEVRYDAGADKPKKSGRGIVILLCCLFAALLIWLLAALLMQLNVLPEWDLGYRWFNAHVFWLFPRSI